MTEHRRLTRLSGLFHHAPTLQHPFLQLDETAPPVPNHPPELPRHIQEAFFLPAPRAQRPHTDRHTLSAPAFATSTRSRIRQHAHINRPLSAQPIPTPSVAAPSSLPDPPDPTETEGERRGRSMSHSARSARPTHIPLPNSPFTGRSPNGSPAATPGLGSPTSPRTSFLPSFMRTRSRAATITHSSSAMRGRASPSVEIGNPLARGPSGPERAGGASSRDPSAGPGVDGGGVTRSSSTPVTGGMASATLTSHPPPDLTMSAAASSSAAPAVQNGVSPKTYRIRLVPHLETSRSLGFDPVVRELSPIVVPPGVTPASAAASVTAVGRLANGRPPALLLKVGRYTDRGNTNPQSNTNGPAPALSIAGGGGDLCSPRVTFKSKVVSRAHAEIWCDNGGKFFIRDTSSSSGTFLNHIRLSSPNTESRPTQINDGDVLQLGVDFQGGNEDQFRCVKMRVELGREWQRAANEFNTNALRQLKALGGAPETPAKGKMTDMSPSTSSRKAKASVTDCCICLFSVTVCQSLFIAPCSHVFHYKCIRPLLQQHHPGFSCPLCRTFANLEEDVETEDAWEIASRRASIISVSRRPSNHSLRLNSSQAAANGQPPADVAGPSSGGIVDDLLGSEAAGSTAEASEEGTGLARQETAVPPTNGDGPDAAGAADDTMNDPAAHGVDVHMAAVREEEAADLLNDPTVRSSLDIMADPSRLDYITSHPPPQGAIGIGARHNATGLEEFGSLSQAATPMNETFLSTLAPGMQQRFDLADQLAEAGTSSSAPSVGRSTPDHHQFSHGEGQHRNGGEPGEDVDMMFT